MSELSARARISPFPYKDQNYKVYNINTWHAYKAIFQWLAFNFAESVTATFDTTVQIMPLRDAVRHSMRPAATATQNSNTTPKFKKNNNNNNKCIHSSFNYHTNESFFPTIFQIA